MSLCRLFNAKSIFMKIVLFQTFQFSDTGALGNAEHPFIAIAPRSTLARNGSTYQWVK